MTGGRYILQEEKEVDITNKVSKFLYFGAAIIVIIALGVAVGVWGWQSTHNGSRLPDGEVTGTMVSARAYADGTISEILVKNGDTVEAGTVIAHVDVKVTEEEVQQLEQTVALSEKNLDELKKGMKVTETSPVPAPSAPVSSGADPEAVARAQSKLNRMNELYQMGAISAMKRDQAEAEYNAAVAASSVSAPAPASQPSSHTVVKPVDPKVIEQAEMQVKQAKAALENAQKDSQATDIIAPVSGTVYIRNDIEEGSDISAGQPIADVVGSDELWVETSVSEKDAAKIKLGVYASCVIDGKKYRGTVSDIIDYTDISDQDTDENSTDKPKRDRITIRIALPEENDNSAIHPGQRAEIKLTK